MAEVYRKMNDEVNALKSDEMVRNEIAELEAATGEPFRDTGYYDFMEYSDGR